MEQFSASPIRIADSIALALTTGSDPGRPRQTGQVWVLGSAPKAVEQPQNILDAVLSSTCTSRPSTGSNEATAASYDGTVAPVERSVMAAPPAREPDQETAHSTAR